MKSRLPSTYLTVLDTLKERIRRAHLQASLSVNAQLLRLYWEIGATILKQQQEEGWGSKVIDRLSSDLRSEFPDMKGLSVRNLKYMRAFAEAYPSLPIVQGPPAQLNNETATTPIVQPSVAQLGASSIVQPSVARLYSLVFNLPWAHNVVLLDRAKDPEIRAFYAQKAIENGWSRDLLVYHIQTGLHRRQGKAITNFELTLPKPHSDLAHETLKNPYVFDFLSISEEMQERDVERELIRHMRKFLLELGKGFAYVGNQYNLNVDGDEYFLDLLFYNYHLHCFVVFELKLGEFKPEYAGKLNFYVNAIDAQLKSTEDKPTIGVLLCKTPNHTVIKYALKGINAPLGVADYKLLQKLPKELKNQMPTVEELEQALELEASDWRNAEQQPLNRIKKVLTSGKKKMTTDRKRKTRNPKRRKRSNE